MSTDPYPAGNRDARHTIAGARQSASLIRDADGDDPGKENVRPSETRKSAKRRKRKSIGQQSLRKKKSSTGAAPARKRDATAEDDDSEAELWGVADDGEDAAPDQAEHSVQLEEAGEPASVSKFSVPRHSLSSSEQILTSGKAAPKRKRRKRKSIGQQAGKKRTSDPTSRRHTIEEPVRSRPAVDSPPPHSESASDGNDEPTTRRRSGRPERNARASSIPLNERVEASGDEDYEDESEDRSPEPLPEAAPQIKRAKGKGNASRRVASSAGVGAASSSTNGGPAKRSKASFPITTHRLTGFDTLPTIHELGESELDSEEEREQEAELRATLDRPNPNAVDVLGQYCRETVQAAIERVTAGNAGDRGDKMRKRAALEAVGRELNDQLVDMSAAVENRIQLARRARKAKRTKAELQSRWLEIRRQREEVSLKCDEVRQQNWQREKDREQKWAISEAAHKLSLEAEKAESQEEQQDSLEFLLRTLAADVSDVAGGGLLSRVRSFNGQLERMAGVLEGREV